MSKRILWDEEEAVLLVDTYEQIKKNPEKRSEFVSALSVNLRRRAKDRGMQIDDVFRNTNGINMRLLEIDKILNPSGAGLGNTSKLFREIVDLSTNHRKSFRKFINITSNRHLIIKYTNFD